MTIDEAIKYAREVAENYNHKLVLNETGHPMHALGDRESARIERYVEQYTQIADWLEYYKKLNDLPNQYADKLYEKAYEKGRKDAIEFISDELIYPLLDEYDRGLWEHINYIELAKEWIKVLDDNPYLKVENHIEARKRDLRQWIAEQLKEWNNGNTNI